GPAAAAGLSARHRARADRRRPLRRRPRRARGGARAGPAHGRPHRGTGGARGGPRARRPYRRPADRQGGARDDVPRAVGARARLLRAGGGAMTGPCAGEACVTCSDEAIPVRVVRLLGDGLAEVETEAGPEEVSVALVEARAGDVVLVHAKEA